MGKYIGAKLKKLRYFKLSFLSGFSSKLLKKEGSLIKKKSKISIFLAQLLEKQKFKYHYGLKEQQIKQYIKYIKIWKIFNLKWN